MKRSIAKFALALFLIFFIVFYFRKNHSHFNQYLAQLDLVGLSQSLTPPNRAANSILLELSSFENYLHPCPEKLYFSPEVMNPDLTMETQITLYNFTPCEYQVVQEIPSPIPKNSMAILLNQRLPILEKQKYEILMSTQYYALLKF